MTWEDEDIKHLARTMRECGVEALEFVRRADSLQPGGDYIRSIRLNPHWQPPEKPEEAPVFDSNPEANALAQREWEKKQAARLALEKQAAEDAIRFAATDGIP